MRLRAVCKMIPLPLTKRSPQHAPNTISINRRDHITDGSVYKSIRLDLALTSITYVHTAHSVDCSVENKHKLISI